MQTEVPSGRYLQHATAAQQTAAGEGGDTGPVLEHDQVMSTLAELDKLGQEGAAPVDDAEVCVQYLSPATTEWKGLKSVFVVQGLYLSKDWQLLPTIGKYACS